MARRSGSLDKRSGRRASGALVAAFAATVVLGTTALAGVFSPVQVLRSAPTGDDLHVEDIAGRGDDLVVGWSEQDVNGSRSYIRWSRDGGGTWSAVTPLLTATRDDPGGVRVDICGPYAWAVQEEFDPAAGKEGALVPILHRTHLNSGAHAAWDLGGSYNDGVDIACGGERFVAVVSVTLDIHSNTRTVQLYVRSVVPGAFATRTFIVGMSDDKGLAVSATNGAIQIAWVRNDGIRYRRYAVANDAEATITPFPKVTAIDLTGPGPWGGSPLLAAHGSRVALAYRHNGGGARVHVSDDGMTFGPAVLSGPDSEAGWVPRSLDMKAHRILFELEEVICCTEDPVTSIGFLSTNLGGDWSETSRNASGTQLGILWRHQDGGRVAEAWDSRYRDPAPLHQKLRFHATAP